MIVSFENMTLKQILELTEKEVIKNHLIKTNWNQAKTAAELEMSRTTLNKKIKEYGITR